MLDIWLLRTSLLRIELSLICALPIELVATA